VRSSTLKSLAYKLVGILVSVVFVYLAVRQVEIREAFRVLGNAQVVPLAAAVFAYLSAFPVRALRWRLILRDQKELSLREVLVPVFVGYMANNLLPARTGEVYRAHFIGRRAGISMSGAAASIVVERTLDGIMLVLTILLVVGLFPDSQFLGIAALVTALVFLILSAIILFHSLGADRTGRLTDLGVVLLPTVLQRRLREHLETFLRGIRGISTVKGFLIASIYSVVVWLLEALAIACVLAAFEISVPLSGFVLVYALVALSTTLPAGPGYVGPYQYAFILSLGVFAISNETALAVSLAAQFSLFGSVTFIGIFLLLREQFLNRGLEDSEGERGEIGVKKIGSASKR
jgi:uncharacterized protein (TIRG00374 family)